MKILIALLFFAFPLAYGETVEFCQGQSNHSIFWQKSVCIGTVTCEVFEPVVNVSDFSEFEYFLEFSQTSGYCGHFETLLKPVSYQIIITDEEFDYTVYGAEASTLADLPDFKLYKEIPYAVKIITNWKTYDSQNSFAEDERGNMIESKPFDHTLSHEIKVKVKEMD